MRNKILMLLLAILITPSLSFAQGLLDIVGHKNETAIKYLFDNGIITGYSDGTFRPDKSLNRAELLKILIAGKGIIPSAEQYSRCFPDVSDEWFAPFVCYAKSAGWVNGYPDGSFKPGNFVNKFEAIKMLVNSRNYAIPHTTNEDIYWFEPFVTVAKDKGLLEAPLQSGFVAAIDGPEEMTRGEISESIYRAIIVDKYSLPDYSWYPNYLSTVDNPNLFPINLRENPKWEVNIIPLDEKEKQSTVYYRISRKDDILNGKLLKIDSMTGLEIEAATSEYGEILKPIFISDSLSIGFEESCIYPNLHMNCDSYRIKIPVKILNQNVAGEVTYSYNGGAGDYKFSTDVKNFIIEIKGKNAFENECNVKGVEHSPYNVYYTEESNKFKDLDFYDCFISEQQAIENGYQKASDN